MTPRFRLAALSLAVLLSGCYSHRVSTVGTDPQGTLPPATDYEGTVAWSLLWGVYERVPVPSNCQGQALAEVRASSNFAFDLLKVATLGAAAPVRMEWQCARATPEPELLDAP